MSARSLITARQLGRRRFLAGAGGVGLTLALVGCGTEGALSDRTAGPTRRVPHRFGETEVPAEPRRIVTVGFTDQDPVLALGTVPVAVTDWYGDYEYATWPWASDRLGSTPPEVLNKGEFTGNQAFDLERLAAISPDLIIGLYTGMTQQEYDQLSRIAPTIAPSGEYPDYGMPWQEAQRSVGLALGRQAQADQLVADVEARFADVRSANPAFDGRSIVLAERFEPGVSFARSPEDPRGRFLTSLGFVIPDDIAALAGDLDGGDVSDERFSLLDRDVLVWNTGFAPEVRAEIEASPVYQQLAVVRENRVVWIEDPIVSAALTWSTALSLPLALDSVVPQLAAVL